MVLPVGAPSKAPVRHAHQQHQQQQRQSRAQLPVGQQQMQRLSQCMAQNVFVQQAHGLGHTEVHLGMSHIPHGGGFFASGLFHHARPRPRALSMQPLPTSQSNEELHKKKSVTIEEPTDQEQSGREAEKGPFRRVPSRNRRQRYYPLNQEDALELLMLLNNQPAPYVLIYRILDYSYFTLYPRTCPLFWLLLTKNAEIIPENPKFLAAKIFDGGDD
ncbi:unnamed protein product, partial [Mesorhabditis spiculigera]